MATSGDVPELEAPGPHREVSSRVQAACDLCGAPHDFSWFGRPEIKARFGPVAENLRLWLGAPVEDCPDLARQMSPATYVSAACPPMLLVHGDRDDIVPVEETEEFFRTLQAAGVDATLRILPGVGHGIDMAPIRDDVVGFFRRTLGEASPPANTGR
jgi:acetyl esterase/lipase